MKVRIITTIVEEVDIQPKDFDLIESTCNRINKVAKEWAGDVLENPTVITTFDIAIRDIT